MIAIMKDANITSDDNETKRQKGQAEENRRIVRGNRIVRGLLVAAVVVIILLLATRCGKETDYLIQAGSDMVPYIAHG